MRYSLANIYEIKRNVLVSYRAVGKNCQNEGNYLDVQDKLANMNFKGG